MGRRKKAETRGRGGGGGGGAPKNSSANQTFVFRCSFFAFGGGEGGRMEGEDESKGSSLGG